MLALGGGFPRLYAAASLKRSDGDAERAAMEQFSAALCRGLIEASHPATPVPPAGPVFRGFMPRPH